MRIQEKLVKAYEGNRWLIRRLTDGVSHTESLAVPDFKANNLNWVLGHIVAARERILDLLGADPLPGPETRALYETGSELITEHTAVRIEVLLQRLDAVQDALDAALTAASDEVLAQIYNAGRGLTYRDRIEGLHWHETYHLGQLEILRQVGAARDPVP